MFIKSFESEKGPKAIGPYSPAVKLGDFVYVSGQLPVNEEGKIDESIELQTRACLENMKNLLNKHICKWFITGFGIKGINTVFKLTVITFNFSIKPKKKRKFHCTCFF